MAGKDQIAFRRFANIPAEDDRTPSDTLRVNGVCPSVLLGGTGVPWPTGVLFLAQTTQREKPS